MNTTTTPRTENEVKILRELGYDIPDPQPQPASPKNLFSMAMAYSSKTQWASGESVRLWQGTVKGNPIMAYLKNEGGIVSLYLTGAPAKCTLFILDIQGWVVSPKAQQNYQDWVSKVNSGKPKESVVRRVA